MRKIVLFVHVSLDGFVAGPGGEMNWIDVSEEIFDHVGQRVSQTDTALYGRTTYQMMESYWPTADQQPSASKHDLEHARWYRNAAKVVISNTLSAEDLPQATVIGRDLVREISQLKQQDGSDILMFGSPTAAHALMAQDLIDGYWLFVNPVLVKSGTRLFEGSRAPSQLRLLDATTFQSGVVCLNYERRV